MFSNKNLILRVVLETYSMSKTVGFPPIADVNATILILGTMPGKESLRKHEYYAHPQNAFWKIMAKLYDFEVNATYEERIKVLKKNNIALWDVMMACERHGSLDSVIENATIVENDFASFYRSHPYIRHVFFNGGTAEKEYFRRVVPKLPQATRRTQYDRLPSTSPAMAQLSFDKKLVAWSKIRSYDSSSNLGC